MALYKTAFANFSFDSGTKLAKVILCQLKDPKGPIFQYFQSHIYFQSVHVIAAGANILSEMKKKKEKTRSKIIEI